MSTKLSRRSFLDNSLKAVPGVVLTGWPASFAGTRVQAASEQTTFTLIDAHTHFYDPTRPEGVPWPPRDDKLLYRTVMPKDYRAIQVPRPVTGTVVVEASPWIEDNQWVLDLAASEPFIVGLVGNLPVGAKEFAGHLNRLATNKLFRGIRLRGRKLEGLLDEQLFVNDLKLVADLDLSLDLVGGSEILPFAERLAGIVPSLRIIIDHLAGVVVNGEPPPADWLKQMRVLEKRSKIFFKVSGLVEGTGRRDGTPPREVDFYRPILDTMTRMFTPERLIYASNWPVGERFAPLGVAQGIVADYFRGLGSRAEQQVFSGSSQAAYRWNRR